MHANIIRFNVIKIITLAVVLAFIAFATLEQKPNSDIFLCMSNDIGCCVKSIAIDSPNKVNQAKWTKTNKEVQNS